MDPHQEQELRARAGNLVLDWHTGGAADEFERASEADFGRLIQASHVVADESRHSLRRWVDAGRRAGLSWSDVGDSLGISRQAAQQRFAGEGTSPTGETDDPSTITRTGVNAFNEVEVLRAEGENGREVTGATWFTLFFRQAGTPCENIRVVSLLPGVVERYEKQGWTHAFTWYPYRYFTRPAGSSE